MEYRGLILDQFQKKAVNALLNDKSVIVSAPTGSGKTLIAEYITQEAINNNLCVVYTAPIKALSNQKYKDFCKLYGKDNVGLITGDISKNSSAPIRIMTTEIFRNMCLSKDESVKNIKYVVLDEVHFIDDPERGYVWEESIIFSPEDTRFLALSATIPNAQELCDWISSIRNHETVCIKHDKRSVPLHISFYHKDAGFCSLQTLHEYYAMNKRNKKRTKPSFDYSAFIEEVVENNPVLYFCFSRKDCEFFADKISKKKFFRPSADISSYVHAHLKNYPDINSLSSVKLLRSCLPQGIGFHHAGLLPIIKDLVEDLFERGLIKILFTTETFAVGINMPAKTVCFNSIRKFDGVNFRFLNSREFYQIAGRAGRRGIDKEGFVVVRIDPRDFDYYKIRRMLYTDEPVISRFKLSYNTVLKMIQEHDQKEIDEILKKSFYAYKENKSLKLRYKNMVAKLKRLKYIKNDKLTDIGIFASKLFCEEITTSQIFATHFSNKLSPIEMCLLISSLCYERRTLKRKVKHKVVQDLYCKLAQNKYLSNVDTFKNLKDMIYIVKPCFDSENFFEVLDSSLLQEGDLLRLILQIIDRIKQIMNATDSETIKGKLEICERVLRNTIQNISVI